MPGGKFSFQTAVFPNRNVQRESGRAGRRTKTQGEQLRLLQGLPGTFPTPINGAPLRMFCIQITNICDPQELSLKHPVCQKERRSNAPIPDHRHRGHRQTRARAGPPVPRLGTNLSFTLLLFLRKGWRPRPPRASDIYSSPHKPGHTERISIGGADRWELTSF